MQRIDVKADAQKALGVIQSGGIVVFPHDCGYGVVGGTEETTNKIFDTKQRGGHKRNTLELIAKHRKQPNYSALAAYF